MNDTLRPYIAKIVATLVSGVAAYVLRKWNLTVDTATQEALTYIIVFGVFGVTDKLVASRVNPADTARISTTAEHTEIENAKTDSAKSENAQVR